MKMKGKLSETTEIIPSSTFFHYIIESILLRETLFDVLFITWKLEQNFAVRYKNIHNTCLLEV